MQHSFDSDCGMAVEPTGEDLGDAMNAGLGDELLVCLSLSEE